MTIELTDIIRETLLDRELSCRQGHNWTTEAELLRSIATVEWEDVPEDGVMKWPMSPALAIQSVIKDLELHGVQRVGRGEVLASAYEHMGPNDGAMYQILATEQVARNGDIQRIWFVDRGTDTVTAMFEVVKAEVPA